MIEENYNTNISETPKKRNHTGLIVILSLLIGVLLGAGGIYYYFEYMNKDNSNNKSSSTTSKSSDEVVITSEYEDLMLDMSRLLYDDSTNNLNFKKMDNQTKLNLAVSLSGKNIDKVSGNELINVIKKHFGSDATLKLEDILCPSHNGVGGSKILYKYSKDGDNFVYNEAHYGHGGSFLGVKTPYIFKNKIITDGKKYKLVVGIYFTGDNCTSDICVPTVKNGLIYKNSSDAENGSNLIFDASKDKSLFTSSGDGIYNYDHDKIYDNVKDRLDTYTFEFEVKDADLIFKKYYRND